MRRGQGKSTFENKKLNMTPLETKNHTLARPELHNADEPEDNDLKNIFRKMIEYLKEDMRKSLKEIEEKTKQKIQDINKSLKETVQDLKTEIQTIKKPQSEKILEIEKLDKRSGTTDELGCKEKRECLLYETDSEVHSSWSPALIYAILLLTCGNQITWSARFCFHT
ncbi:vomeronasal 2 receptor, 52 precursor [Cricetulus griseus]|nr:vomeronasal 2 receptor, 52 precursor [Cricetulus griseus]